MKNFFAVILLLTAGAAMAQKPGKAMIAPAIVTKDVMALAYYQRDHLRLAGDFTAYDNHLRPISKKEFLQGLTTGTYLPLRLSSPSETWTYKLYPLTGYEPKGIKEVIKQFANTYLAHYKMEGKKFPPFHYTDLNGKVYTPGNTKGKIIVLKSWFIHCQACNEEMPELNEVVNYYKNRKDILFISIAFDLKAKLVEFERKKAFRYAIVPVKESYIEKTLLTNEYPTHWIINKQGIIIKMVNEPAEMISALNREAAK
jgi:peroxiredoxin